MHDQEWHQHHDSSSPLGEVWHSEAGHWDLYVMPYTTAGPRSFYAHIARKDKPTVRTHAKFGCKSIAEAMGAAENLLDTRAKATDAAIPYDAEAGRHHDNYVDQIAEGGKP